MTISYEHITTMNTHNIETTTTIHSLPPELFTHILLQFDFLHMLPHRTASLRACSLTCRAWVAPSHRLLFNSFTIPAFPCYLLSVLQALPDIARYVKSLTILQTTLHDWDSLPSFSKILTRFHHVPTLSIDPWNLPSRSDHKLQYPLAAYPILLKSFPLVEKLILRRWTPGSLRIMLVIIRSYERLKNIEVMEIKRSKNIASGGDYTLPLDLTPIAVALDDIAPLKCLQHLMVCTPNSDIVLWWFSSHPPVNLTKIAVIGLTQEDVPPLAVLLRRAGPSLHHLLLTFFSGKYDCIAGIRSIAQVQELSSSISHNTALRSLELQNRAVLPSFFAAWVPNLLSQMTSTTMESIISNLSFYPTTWPTTLKRDLGGRCQTLLPGLPLTCGSLRHQGGNRAIAQGTDVFGRCRLVSESSNQSHCPPSPHTPLTPCPRSLHHTPTVRRPRPAPTHRSPPPPHTHRVPPTPPADPTAPHCSPPCPDPTQRAPPHPLSPPTAFRRPQHTRPAPTPPAHPPPVPPTPAVPAALPHSPALPRPDPPSSGAPRTPTVPCRLLPLSPPPPCRRHADRRRRRGCYSLPPDLRAAAAAPLTHRFSGVLRGTPERSAGPRSAPEDCISDSFSGLIGGIRPLFCGLPPLSRPHALSSALLLSCAPRYLHGVVVWSRLSPLTPTFW
ncbi:hypothetical protein K439DRAFT_1665800 [Ramaria rubella]|nr:hypothetical protein K439DRAFT_1665800 [Ramaria rubella]